MNIRCFTPFLMVLTFALSHSLIFAQDEEELSLDSGTLDSQFEYLFEESHNYKHYEEIPHNWLKKVRESAADTLRELHGEIRSLRTEISENQSTISNLRNQLGQTQDTLEETRAAQNSMAFAGSVPMEKSLYRVIMWSIIGGLLLLLIIFIYRFSKSNRVTKQTRGRLAEIQEEMDMQKKRALEREQKLSRELQDERNKNRKA